MVTSNNLFALKWIRHKSIIYSQFSRSNSTIMDYNCVALGCTTTTTAKIRKLFRFPIVDHINSQTASITRARQEAWVVALNRDDLPELHYAKARVCDLHFVSGRWFWLHLVWSYFKQEFRFREACVLY